MSYLFAGFLVVWTLLFGYIFFLARAQKKLTAELESLKDSLQRHDKNPG